MLICMDCGRENIGRDFQCECGNIDNTRFTEKEKMVIPKSKTETVVIQNDFKEELKPIPKEDITDTENKKVVGVGAPVASLKELKDSIEEEKKIDLFKNKKREIKTSSNFKKTTKSTKKFKNKKKKK